MPYPRDAALHAGAPQQEAPPSAAAAGVVGAHVAQILQQEASLLPFKVCAALLFCFVAFL